MPKPRRDREPMDALYFDYATGALSEPGRILLDTHFAMRPERRVYAALWEAVGSTLLDGDVESVDEEALNAVLARVQADRTGAGRPLSDLPGPLGKVVGRPLDRLEWREAAPGALEYVMPRWPQARLIRFSEQQAPGWTLGPEMSLVLKGGLESDGDLHEVGDLLVLDRSEGVPRATSGECLYFSVQDSGYTARGVRTTVTRPGGVESWAWRRD